MLTTDDAMTRHVVAGEPDPGRWIVGIDGSAMRRQRSALGCRQRSRSSDEHRAADGMADADGRGLPDVQPVGDGVRRLRTHRSRGRRDRGSGGTLPRRPRCSGRVVRRQRRSGRGTPRRVGARRAARGRKPWSWRIRPTAPRLDQHAVRHARDGADRRRARRRRADRHTAHPRRLRRLPERPRLQHDGRCGSRRRARPWWSRGSGMRRRWPWARMPSSSPMRAIWRRSVSTISWNRSNTKRTAADVTLEREFIRGTPAPRCRAQSRRGRSRRRGSARARGRRFGPAGFGVDVDPASCPAPDRRRALLRFVSDRCTPAGHLSRIVVSEDRHEACDERQCQHDPRLSAR